MMPWTRRRLAREAAATAERRERADERLAFLDAVKSMTTASTANANAFQSFLDSFKLTDAPRVRAFDEEADFNRWLEARAMTGSDDYIDQYKALAAKLDAFETGE